MRTNKISYKWNNKYCIIDPNKRLNYENLNHHKETVNEIKNRTNKRDKA